MSTRFRYMKFEDYVMVVPDEGPVQLSRLGIVVAKGEKAWAEFFYAVKANDLTEEGEADVNDFN